MSQDQHESRASRLILSVSGAKFIFSPVKMARRPSEVPADWSRFMRGYVPDTDLSEEEAQELQQFMRAHQTEAVIDGDSYYTLANGRLAYCEPSAISDYPGYRVLGAHANGNFFDIQVQAKDGLSAFGAAALELQEAGEEGDATFHVSVPVGSTYDQPGDSLVSLETVLDPEQAEVFGLSAGSEQQASRPVAQGAMETADATLGWLGATIADLEPWKVQALAHAMGPDKVLSVVTQMLHAIAPEQVVEAAMEPIRAERDRLHNAAAGQGGA